MPKPLAFKGDKKPPKKRKRAAEDDESKQLAPQQPEISPDDDAWLSALSPSEISGPILLVLPTTSPTSLSTDALGAVFAQKIENLVEGLPDSAEPHDVRQVWVATRVVGSEDKFTFKGSAGRFGVLGARSEAISPEEVFTVVKAEEGRFGVKTMRGTFVDCVDGEDGAAPVVRGDAESEGDGTKLRVRMQARFKVTHQVEKAEKLYAKISRKELEAEVGRSLEDDEVRKLKKARREGNYHEVMLDVKVKGKHDKFA
ncbi:hypothetical protein LTR56_018139 [Elasticomyces elasticus]|nr:hypothetical protein LTR22_023139 [Elasticomyces elasticus]KAK3629252.1 hypothetical protein LTR56_018139 [Elasticomyces elasticus]KAK4912835.1 hypothetical protein LTR49_018797 [Elasticomyces elasticus]KAK5747311.1 hypothetical protein LTS12_022425 [Elasticomyces elasticus]